MKILYVSQYFPPEIGAPSARVSELTAYWARWGHQVTVLTGFPNHPTGKIVPEYRARFRRFSSREQVDGVDVVRTWLWPLPNRKSWERIVNYSSFCFSAGLRGLFLRRPDVIIATSPQLLVGLSGWWLGLVKRAPVIFEVRDIWPDAIVASGIGREDSLFVRILRAISRFLHRRSDHVVVVTEAFKNELVDKWDVQSSSISVVTNGVETQIFKPGDNGEAEKRALGLEDKFVVTYIGTLGFAHGLETVIEAAIRLKTAHSDIAFLLVGEGAESEKLRARVLIEALENVIVLGQQSRAAIPGIICASDVCLVLLRADDVFKTVIPTKMLEYMSCARPMIVGVDGQARAIMDEAQGGVFIQPEDAEGLVQAILDLKAAPELRERLGKSGRDYVEVNLSREDTAARYINLLEDVVGPNKTRR